MSQQDIEMLRGGYAAFNRGDRTAMLSRAAPDIELIPADRVTHPGTYRGVAEISRFFQDLFEPFEEISIEPERFVQRGDRIAALLRVRLRPKGSAAVIENRIGHVWTVRDGRATRFEIFPEREKAFQAIGLSPAEADAGAA